MNQRYEKNTALFFGEGGKEKHFFTMLERSNRFKELFPQWNLSIDAASGEACKVILEKCIRFCHSNKNFDLVVCFIDSDKLFDDFGSDADAHRESLEELAKENRIKIVWQVENHEDEISRAVGREINKSRLKQVMRAKEVKISNSQFAKRVLKLFSDFEAGKVDE